MTDTRPTPDVIIVGAGPVGLGAALELARFGVRSILIEKHESTSWHPKTRNLNTRTMEIARGWGPTVYRRLRSIDTPPGWKSPIRFLESVTGREFGTIESHGFEGPGPAVSPAEPIMSSQELMEEILLDAVRATGLVDVRFGCEAVSLQRGGEPHATGVALRVRTSRTDREEVLTAHALVAADGASSLIRDEIGVRMEGQQDQGYMVNCYFRAPIEPHLQDRKGVLLFVSNDHARGVLQPLDGAGRWLCQINVRPERWSPEQFTNDDASRWIRAAVGVDDLDPEVRSLGFWKINATVAERMVSGRVILCGDAAHQFPPTGGLGVNTGLQGMHNVMWKLAYVLHGHAGDDLLRTYEAERHALAARITNQSLQNSINVGRINRAAAARGESGLTTEAVLTESRRYGNHLGIEFGAHYQSSAVIPDGTLPPTVDDTYSDYIPSATPGCRAPHAWLGHGETALSTLDLFGPGFTLLAAPAGDAWCVAARAAAADRRVPLVTYQLGHPGLPDSGEITRAYGIGQHGAVLVRPDGHIAWRTTAPAPGTATTDLHGHLTRLLAH